MEILRQNIKEKLIPIKESDIEQSTVLSDILGKLFYLNNSFLQAVNEEVKQMKDRQHGVIDDNTKFVDKKTIENKLHEIDGLAIANESTYWSIKFYELSDGFFPSGPATIELYRDLRTSQLHQDSKICNIGRI